MTVPISPAMQLSPSNVFALVALGACATQPSAVRPGTGSNHGSGSGTDMGSGSAVSMGSGSNGSAQPPPPPGTLYGSVLDERGDQIDFSTGEPVHTHAGPSIDLATGCPAVYKYAYLEDQTDPTFGRQTAINPLEWHVTSQVGSLDDDLTAYRVRLPDGTIALDWTAAAAPDADGLYTIRLYRNVVSAIGDHTGKMFVDVRFTDTAGNETVDSACWENHPMAAPLEVQAAATSDFFTWSLPAHSPISTAINTASIDSTATEQLGASMFTQGFVQHTAEPVTLHLDHNAITGTTSSFVVQYLANGITRTEAVPCAAVDPTICAPAPTPSPPITRTGTLQATWDIRVIDPATGAMLCHNPDTLGGGSEAIDGCVVPARGAAEAPHPYQIIYSMSDTTSIQPAPDSTTSESTITTGFLKHTGTLGSAGKISWCATVSTDGRTCTEGETGFLADVLDKAHIDFNAIQLIVQTAPDATASLESIGSYAAPSLSIAAQSWDAGDAGLAP